MGINVQVSATSSKEAEPIVDDDIRAFEAWFREEKGQEPLAGSEKAIIKTYLWWKLFGGKKSAE